MKRISLFFAMSVLATMLFSCSRPGTGGDNTLVVFPKHHGQPIKGATVYLRFGAKDFPGSAPTDYDMTTVGEANEEHVHVEGLRKGDYYIYAVGYDSTISAVVTGGQAYKITSKSGEHDVDVAVTE